MSLDALLLLIVTPVALAPASVTALEMLKVPLHEYEPLGMITFTVPLSGAALHAA